MGTESEYLTYFVRHLLTHFAALFLLISAFGGQAKQSGGTPSFGGGGGGAFG